ncbi:50S ribosomal protein L6 [Wolbachia endosymbiont of Dipetalonema caudispina]|uniref:50S ribosomal protein L6 n=1 Tax=Wolbachia endosymbiont of Dipetalonema caudispina TaxID=1812112 RepID=UPI00158CA341|nr:50S ribosomal protein L6 [Wolbachia endosymbiont of Dipetalonema caudispina]QKX01165.1 50S ribosomal protein L6 [Wolbachia endosymbiont of Dipetalonema caudispina]
MSRVGAAPINIPTNILVKYNDGKILIKSAKAERCLKLDNNIICCIIGNQLLLSIDQSKGNYDEIKSMWGTYRSNINNIINGMVSDFSVDLEINGIGYKAECDGEYLTLSLGYSHNIKYKVPKDIKIECIKPIYLMVSGMDKQKVYMVASDICRLRKYDPYKGKGVIIKGKFVLRKVVSKKN